MKIASQRYMHPTERSEDRVPSAGTSRASASSRTAGTPRVGMVRWYLQRRVADAPGVPAVLQHASMTWRFLALTNACRAFRRMVCALLPTSMLWVAACSQGQDMDTMIDSKPDAEEEAPLRKLNPAPKRAYAITMKIAGAPGPFEIVEGTAQYTVKNPAECGKKIAIAGVFPRMTSNEPFTLTRVSDSEYRGIVYSDLIIDEDYFGRGVCRWEFFSVNMHLRATADESDTRFIPSIDADVVVSSGSETKYFWEDRYPKVEDYSGFPVFGEDDLESVPPDKRGEFFSITLAAAELTP